MLWVKALHIIFMVTWFSGLFTCHGFMFITPKAMMRLAIIVSRSWKRKLFYGIATPGAILTIVFGIWLITYSPSAYFHLVWLWAKLIMVLFLNNFIMFSGKLLYDFKHDRNQHSHVFYRWINEIPVLFLVGIVILVIVKPWGTI